MKTKYRKVMRPRAEHAGDFWYVWNGRGYHRPIKTFNEIRQNICDQCDLRGEPRSCQPRARRSRVELDAWNDECRDRNYGKSWKHFTRHRKQWMVGSDPKPRVEYPEGLTLRLALSVMSLDDVLREFYGLDLIDE